MKQHQSCRGILGGGNETTAKLSRYFRRGNETTAKLSRYFRRGNETTPKLSGILGGGMKQHQSCQVF